MPSDDYMRPEPGRGKSVVDAYGGHSPDKELTVEVDRMFADLAASLFADDGMTKDQIVGLFDQAIGRVFGGD